MSLRWHRLAMTLLYAGAVLAGAWMVKHGFDAITIALILLSSALWAIIEQDKRNSLECDERTVNRNLRDYFRR